jgi:hypothetical protein
MATKKIRLPVDSNGFPVQGALHPDTVSEQVVAFDASSRNATSLVCQVVRVWATQDCHLAFGGPGVVATTANLLLLKNTPEYFSLNNDGYIAVIKDTLAGNLYITPMD